MTAVGFSFRHFKQAGTGSGFTMRVKRSLGLPYEAIEFCRRITQKHSQTFYLGSCLFPSGQREAVWAVYAACRLGDDIVDRDVPHLAFDVRHEGTVKTSLQGQVLLRPPLLPA